MNWSVGSIEASWTTGPMGNKFQFWILFEVGILYCRHIVLSSECLKWIIYCCSVNYLSIYIRIEILKGKSQINASFSHNFSVEFLSSLYLRKMPAVWIYFAFVKLRLKCGLFAASEAGPRSEPRTGIVKAQFVWCFWNYFSIRTFSVKQKKHLG